MGSGTDWRTLPSPWAHHSHHVGSSVPEMTRRWSLGLEWDSRWDGRRVEREPNWDEATNLEVNSKSLSDVYSRLSGLRTTEVTDDGPFGLHSGDRDFSSAPLLKKMPSDPDFSKSTHRI